jgi:hypothetical protein
MGGFEPDIRIKETWERYRRIRHKIEQVFAAQNKRSVQALTC